jgi:hypothetical protein
MAEGFGRKNLISRFIEMRDQMELPIGLVLKELGAQPLHTRLLDPHQAMRQMRKIKYAMPLLLRKERNLRQSVKQERLHVPRLKLQREQPNSDIRVF